MKKHKDRVFWIGKEGKSHGELSLGHNVIIPTMDMAQLPFWKCSTKK
jgi:hypothetical protein